MSMISVQCDELREWASELRVLANGPVNEGFPARANLFDSADAMCQAADTIWELRCKLAGMVDQREEIERLKAENAKLLVERDEWHRVAKNKQDIIDHMRDARAENAKLRELVRKWYPHMLKRVGRDALEQWGQMDVVRELRIEVDG